MTTPELEQKIADLEKRLAFLEGTEKYMAALRAERRRNRCHWVKDASCPGGRFWLPVCWGGVHNGSAGCYC